jgi:hypothetical protein
MSMTGANWSEGRRNHGEGGILALMSMTGANWSEGRRTLIVMGLFGAALIYGDAIITPAISVLSALEGLNVATDVFKPHFVSMAVGSLRDSLSSRPKARHRASPQPHSSSFRRSKCCRLSFRLWLPLSRKFLRLGNLRWRHDLCHQITKFFRILIALRRRQVDPHKRPDIVLRHAPAVGVHDADIVLSSGLALVGRLPIPTHRSRIILRDTLAVGVHVPEIELCIGIALVGRFLIPAYRSRIVLRHALAYFIHEQKIELSLGVALVGRFAKPSERSRIVLRHSLAVDVHEPEPCLSAGVALVGEGAQESHRGRIVAALISRLPIFQRPCGYRSRKTDGRNERGGSFQRVFHYRRRAFVATF